MNRRPIHTKISTLLITAMAFILLLASCSKTEQSWQRIVDEGKLTIGLDPSFPPFEATDGTAVYGIDVDLANAVAAELGLEANFTYFGYDGLYDALLSKQVDVLISALAIFPERTRDFSYSESYFDAGQVLISPSDSQFEGIEDLNSQTIAVELGAEGHTLSTSWQRQKPGLIIFTFNSAEDALNALNTGKVDLSVVDSIGALLYINKKGLRANTFHVTNEPFAMVVRSDDTILLEKLNLSLGTIKESGQLDIIIDKWLGQ
ncbi:MAG: transporter substrate-binding domain-containing protein [Anaerolineae bacterium]|nr:MAG: transporter substrate-binding domain-containing protein [Anaerolineae bacterium]